MRDVKSRRSGEIHKYTVNELKDTFSGGTIHLAKTAPTNIQAATFAGAAVANPPMERLTRLPRKIEEADHWSPTQQEVDAYINSLEEELLQSCEDLPDRLGDRHKRAAPIKDRPSNSFTLFWGLVAIAAGCFWELARIILKALN